MVRLTVVLLAGLYATMVIWGDPLRSDVAVTRTESLAPAVPALATTAASEGPAERQQAVPDVSEAEAVEIALAAAGNDATPVEPAPGTVEPSAEEPPELDLWYVTGSRVNLRSGPTTKSAIVGGVGFGERAEILSDPAESWIRIRTETGIEAWIYGGFLSETPA